MDIAYYGSFHFCGFLGVRDLVGIASDGEDLRVVDGKDKKISEWEEGIMLNRN